MFRRTSPRKATTPSPSGPLAGVDRSGHPVTDGHGNLASRLVDSGWVLPRGLRLGRTAWSLVGTVSSPLVTPVDGAGMVSGQGWGLDWWVGADDRWRIPAREASVRQSLLGGAPVVETLLRVPGGEAVHRAYGIRSPRAFGDEWVVSEVENRTAIPFATVLVVRPFMADGVGSVSEITLEPVGGGRGRDVAHLVRVDGRPAVVVPRRPARVAVGNRSDGDLVERVLSGEADTDLLSASCPDGLATLAMIFPTPHTATLRAVLPVGEVGSGPVDYPGVVPDAATVASGWEVHRRGPRLEVPDQHLASALTQARGHLNLAHDGEAVRRDGLGCADMELGATEVLLGAFDLLDRPADVGVVVARWVERLASASPDEDALVLAVVARHWCVHRVDALLDWMLPEVAAAVERIDRAERRGGLADPVLRWRVAASLAAAGHMLELAGQPDAARSVAALTARVGEGAMDPASEAALDADGSPGGGEAVAPIGRGGFVDRLLVARGTDLDALVAEAGPLTTWTGPGLAGRTIGHDLAASAAFVIALRHQLVSETADGLALVPVHPDGWYGGGVEVHDLPTEWGRISFGIRWHGIRPALLWDLEPHVGSGAVVLTAPGLDPSWSTTDRRGEALLGEVRPPGGLKSLTVVAEHPDIDPVMRRPGSDPGPSSLPLDPMGGSFS